MSHNKQTDKQITRTREALIKTRQIERELEIGNFGNLSYFLKYSGQQALDYALEWTAYYGKIDLVKQCIKYGANIHANKEVALQMACENGHLDTVRYLVSLGADINVDDSFPLICAIDKENINIVEYLLGLKDANGKKICNVNGMYEGPLLIAINNEYHNIVKLLIDNGADINICDGVALLTAAKNGNLDIVKLLVESGINRDAIPTAIEFAQKENHLDIVGYLTNIIHTTSAHQDH